MLAHRDLCWELALLVPAEEINEDLCISEEFDRSSGLEPAPAELAEIASEFDHKFEEENYVTIR